MAEPNQALVLGIGGRGGRGGGRSFPVRNTIELRTWDLRQHKTTTDDWAAAFRRAVELRTRGLKHKVFIGLSSGYDSGAIMLSMLQRRVPFLVLAIRGREVRFARTCGVRPPSLHQQGACCCHPRAELDV